ncbi:IS200/IS605 family transposase [Algoriphagus taiwanensis]
MPNTYSKMYCQAVFAVKYRRAAIRDDFKSKLFAVIGNLINEMGAKTLIVNGHVDHVHCLFQFYPKQAVSEIMQSAKAKSSKWLNESKLTGCRFEWQSGYGAFTYSEREISAVFEYVKNQERHHQEMTFQEEYRKMLEAHHIEFLPEYLFKELE